MFTLGILHSTIRSEEKLLEKEALNKGIKVEIIDVRNEILNPDFNNFKIDVALERCISTIQGSYAINFLESLNIPVINSSLISNICQDKFLTSLVLSKAGVNTPPFALVFSLDEAIKAVDELGGFPVVIKPNLGSWGRLLAKINDIDALESVIEHKNVLGSPQQKAIYLQKYVDKPGRDIRVFIIDSVPICAIYRNSKHWITNTARGGEALNCPLTKELIDISKNTSDAIGGGILAIDVFETDNGFSINEVNHTMEFKNSEIPTGVSISGAIIDYCIKVYKKL